jgi:hypothetical protein
MTAHLRDISATLRAIAAGEIEINDSQAARSRKPPPSSATRSRTRPIRGC